MSTTPNDGGPAFPTHDVWEDFGPLGESGPIMNQTTNYGMTLRDWFAGQALAGYLAGRNSDSRDTVRPNVATCCYQYADAMLAARKTPTGGQE